MARTKKSTAKFVKVGYGQVEPNHLSAQRTAQIYAQLPAASDIDVLENGQFVKYNYKDGVVDYSGAGEWMLVFNEVKVYRDYETDCDFAMIKENYVARIYSPMGDLNPEAPYANARNYKGVVNAYEHDITSTDDPFVIEQRVAPYTEMPTGTVMVPRVFKTNVGDIFTTNTIDEETLAVGDILTPNAKGYLAKGEGDMQWQVVKVYTLADRQPAVKVMRIA